MQEEKLDERQNMRVKFWGVRGSLPAPLTKEQLLAKQEALIKKVLEDRPDPERVREYLESLPMALAGTYGGNTTCISVEARDSPLIVMDAGSAMRDLGNTLIGRLFSNKHFNPLCSTEEGMRDAHVFFTHYHWDHLQGFPFFAPAFIGIKGKRAQIHFYGKKNTMSTISDVLEGQQEYPTFPVDWGDMPCAKEYHELCRMASRPVRIGRAVVSYAELTHPNSVFAYRVDSGDGEDSKSVVIATDTEHKDSPDPRLVQLAKDADILYYDGQYTPEEYVGQKGPNKFDWGHSTYEWAIRNALAAGVRTVVIGHHDPAASDQKLDDIAARAEGFKEQQLELEENQGKNLEVVMAYDGLEQTL